MYFLSYEVITYKYYMDYAYFIPVYEKTSTEIVV
jgi:hypothetical protein